MSFCYQDQTAQTDILLGQQNIIPAFLFSINFQVNIKLTFDKQPLNREIVFSLHVCFAFLTLGPSLCQGPADPPPALFFPFLLDADV